MPMRNLGNYKTKMKVTWDEEEGYHRLSDNDNMSVLVTELGELEDKDISFICQQLNIIVHTHRKRLFAEIRKKAMDIYISEYQLSGHTKNVLKLSPQLPAQETVFQHPPPLPQPISSYERTTKDAELLSGETVTTSL